jgi:hypothetical protein
LNLIKICDMNISVQGTFLRIARLDAEKFLFLDEPEPVIEGLRKLKSRVDVFTFMQRLPETTPKYSFPMEMDNLAVLPISTFDQWWTQRIGFKARNKAKQATKKGVTLHEVPFSEELVRGIWKIYNECPIRQGRKFPHYGKNFEAVYQEEATYLESSIFIGAFLDCKLIGFVKLLVDHTRTQAGLLNIVSLIGQRDLAPSNALISQAVRSCADRKIPYLVYSNFAYGKRERDSLSDFKKRNGFERVDLPRYFVPLSPFGHVALRLGFHKKLLDRIPGPLVVKLRELRNQWYKRRLDSTAEAS